MIKIWSRLPPEQVPRSLRITDGETHAGMATAAAAAFIARNATAASSGVQHGRQQSLPTHATMSAGKAGQGVTKNRVGASLPSSTIAGRGAPFFVYSEPGLTPLSFCRLVIEMLPSLWHVVSSANLLHRKNLKELPVFYVRCHVLCSSYTSTPAQSITSLLFFFLSQRPLARAQPTATCEHARPASRCIRRRPLSSGPSEDSRLRLGVHAAIELREDIILAARVRIQAADRQHEDRLRAGAVGWTAGVLRRAVRSGEYLGQAVVGVGVGEGCEAAEVLAAWVRRQEDKAHQLSSARGR